MIWWNFNVGSCKHNLLVNPFSMCDDLVVFILIEYVSINIKPPISGAIGVHIFGCPCRHFGSSWLNPQHSGAFARQVRTPEQANMSSGSSDESANRKGRGQSSKTSVRSKAASTHKSGARAAAAKRYEGQSCGLCQQDDPTPTTKWQKHMFHKAPCYRGMRSHQQVLAKIPGALAKDVALWKTDKEQWRKENQPHASKDNNVKKEARRATRSKYSTKKKVRGKRSEKAKLKLNRRHYKSWKRTWENMESDEASADFDLKYDTQGLILKCSVEIIMGNRGKS